MQNFLFNDVFNGKHNVLDIYIWLDTNYIFSNTPEQEP